MQFLSPTETLSSRRCAPPHFILLTPLSLPFLLSFVNVRLKVPYFNPSSTAATPLSTTQYWDAIYKKLKSENVSRKKPWKRRSLLASTEYIPAQLTNSAVNTVKLTPNNSLSLPPPLSAVRVGNRSLPDPPHLHDPNRFHPYPCSHPRWYLASDRKRNLLPPSPSLLPLFCGRVSV